TAQCIAAGGQCRGAGDGLPARRQHDRRDRVRLARPWPPGGGKYFPAQLSVGAGCRAALRSDLCADQLGGRSAVHGAKSARAAVSLPLRSVIATPAKAGGRNLGRDCFATLAMTGVAAFLVMALFAPWMAPHDPAAADLFRRLQPPFWLDGGDFSYPLGCDA